MNDRIDVIAVLRQANPVPRGTVDDAAYPTAAELQESLRAEELIVEDVSFGQHTGDRRRRWPAYVAVGAAIAAGVTAIALIAGDDDDVDLTPETVPRGSGFGACWSGYQTPYSKDAFSFGSKSLGAASQASSTRLPSADPPNRYAAETKNDA